MNHAEHCDALELEVERFAASMSLVSGDTIVATCPGWTVDDVALHLGTIHRWAEELVRTRSSVRILGQRRPSAKCPCPLSGYATADASW